MSMNYNQTSYDHNLAPFSKYSYVAEQKPMNQLNGHIHRIHIWKEVSWLYAQRRKRQILQPAVKVLFKKVLLYQTAEEEARPDVL